MFALVDCNNFYASCERAFRPELEGRAVVVLSNNDGCVIARSNEAKELGIKMGEPAFQLQQRFNYTPIEIFSSNYELYGDMSFRVMKTLSAFTPDIEQYSIDEMFLSLKGFQGYDLRAYGEKMRSSVRRNCWIPVCVGMAPTKALAKVANRIAKKYQEKLSGVHIIDTDEKRYKALKWLPIEDVWGIGRQFQKKLKDANVHTAYDFTCLPDEAVRSMMSVVGLRLKKELEGRRHLELERQTVKKSIATTRSFAADIASFDEVRERVVTYAVRCAEKLRQQKSYCSKVEVFVLTNPFRDDRPQYANKILMTLPFPSNSDITIAKSAAQGLEIIFREGFGYKKAGVVVHGLVPQPYRQGNLFTAENPKHEKLMKVMDTLNKYQLDQVVRIASQDLKREKMRRERLSPYYTTRWENVIEIK